MSNRGRFAAAALGVALVIVWWMRREPSWSVAVTADQDAEVTPWQPVALTATVMPADVVDGHVLEGGSWHYAWDDNGEPLQIDSLAGTWRAGKLGEHIITLTVESPWGTTAASSIKKTVAHKGFMLPDSPTLPQPDAAILPSDPRPPNLPVLLPR